MNDMSPMRPAIRGFTGEHRFLSNFWYSPMTVEGMHWPTAEHNYQAAKAISSQDVYRIQQCETPGQAKRMGKTIPIREDWEQIKVSVMHQIVWEKFTQNNALQEKLLATGNALLVEENDWGDTLWGTCKGMGENLLGRILMSVRKDLGSPSNTPVVFVFGSNEAGRHGKGAALTAVQNHGAIPGKGYGRQGMSFGIPTKTGDLKVLPLNVIGEYVKDFLVHARNQPDTVFQVTRIGCGLAGYQDRQIAPLFKGAPENCMFDTKWGRLLDDVLFWGTF